MRISKFIVPDGQKITLFSTDNFNSGTLSMEGSAVKVTGAGDHVIVSPGHNLYFSGSTHTIGGNNTMLTIGRAGDAININNLNSVSGDVNFTGAQTIGGMLTLRGQGSMMGSGFGLEDVALNIEHAAAGGSSSIYFKSTQGFPSDYGYIRFQDSTGAAGTEDAALTIGVENDQGSNDRVIIRSRTVINSQGISSSHANIIEFQASGTERARITNAGNMTLSGTFTPSGMIFANGHLRLPSGGEIQSGHNSNYIIKDHSNGNVTLSAAGGDLFVGFQNTNKVLQRAHLYTSDGANFIAQTDGTLFYQGTNTDNRYARLAGATFTGAVTMSNTLTVTNNVSISGTLTSSSSSSLIATRSTRKSWIVHRPDNNNLIFAPSASANGTDWDWTKQVIFDDSGEIFATGNKKVFHEGNFTPGDYVTVATDQTITGQKVFSRPIQMMINDNGTNRTFNVINMYGGGVSGAGIAIGSGGATILGSGESAGAVRPNLSAADETLALASDANIVLYSNLQNGWGSRVTATFDNTGRLTIPSIRIGSSATAGQVLTADGNGNGSWANLPADRFLSAVSSTDGGNGTMTFTITNGTNVTFNAAHEHGRLISSDLRSSLKPSNLIANRMHFFFSSRNGIESNSSGGAFQDTLAFSSWSDASGGRVNLLALDKNSMAIRHYQGTYGDSAVGAWGTPKTLAYSEDVLPLTGGTLSGILNLNNVLRFDGTPTTTNQSLGIRWTAFDKEGVADFSDTAHIIHTVNSGGFTGSVLEISSQNDANDGVNFVVNSTDSGVRINGNKIWNAGNFDPATKSDVHTHPFDNYQNWKVKGGATDSPLDITSGSTLTFAGSGATTISRSGNTITISSTDTNTTYGVVTATTDGLAPRFVTVDTTKYLRADGTWQVPPDTNTWVANSAANDGFVLKGTGNANKVWKTDASGNPGWRDDADTDTTYAVFTRTVNGLVPAPGGATSTRYLREDGTWVIPTDTNTTYTAGDGITLTGTTFSANLGNGLSLDTSTPTKKIQITSHAGTAGSIGTINVAATTIGVSLGNTGTTACAGNDSRLSNDRTPTSHGQDKHTVVSRFARITFPAGRSQAVWTHNQNWANYVVQITPNSPETHFYYTNRTNNAVTICLDDEAYEALDVDVVITLTDSITTTGFTIT